MPKQVKLSGAPKFLHLFLWYVGTAFGIIFSSCAEAAEVKDLYKASDLRDPFVPLVTQNQTPVASGLLGVERIEEISIQGIVYDPKNGSIVIVNDALLKEGEEQGAVKVLKVEPNRVLFMVNGVQAYKAQYEDEEAQEGNS